MAYHPGAWQNFFVASAGAAAALAGLVIVAVSVNIQHILKGANLPARAAATIGALVLILVASICSLIPGQGNLFLGLEIFTFAILVWWLQMTSTRRHKSANRPRFEVVIDAVAGQVQVIPFLIGSFSLMVGSGGGIYWIAAGFVAVFVTSMINTWILLVEILR